MSIVSPLHSLQGRLLLASTAVLPVVLLLAGLALSQAYHHTLESSLKQRLQIQVYLLLGAIELEKDHLRFPERLQEPRYEQVGSGLYAAIHNSSNEMLWRSFSSTFFELKEYIELIDFSAQEPGKAEFQHLEDKALYRFQLRVIWDIEGHQQALLFSVMESDQQLLLESRSYNQALMFWLSIIFLVALLAQAMIMRWGLLPLKQLAADLKQIEQGKSEALSGNYPAEVEPVTENLNLLIRGERLQRERYRNTLADLAHSLKTPLAVIRGQRQISVSDNEMQLIDEQVERMDQIIQYQLNRAVQSQKPTLGRKVPVLAVAERICNALDKVYRDKTIGCSIDIAPSLSFYGDERDLMELLGNILENAYKYGKQQIILQGVQQEQSITLAISDDGPGVTEPERKTILERGARLDSSIQGQGIGLSVVTEIISNYNGELSVESSPLGGSSFIITLPS